MSHLDGNNWNVFRFGFGLNDGHEANEAVDRQHRGAEVGHSRNIDRSSIFNGAIFEITSRLILQKIKDEINFMLQTKSLLKL